MKKLINYFTKTEKLLWSLSVFIIVLSFCIFDRENYLTLAASLIGASSLILSAKGNPTGQALMIVFSIIYGIISYQCRYYGEMATYMGMTMPMAVISLISWLRNPYKGKKAEVKVNTLKAVEVIFMILLTLAVSAAFYFLLKFLGTAYLELSTISVATSFAAVYLTARRSAFFALAYALNDIVLIILWILASISDFSYISVTVCFCMFLANDIYGFINWRKMKNHQQRDAACF